MRRVSAPSAVDGASAPHTLYGATMGTRWRVDLVAPRAFALDPLHAAVQARLDAIVAQMSSWEPDSDLSRFNRAAAGTWHRLQDDFYRVMACALQVAQASDGAFDPAIGRLVAAWGFGAQAGARQAPGPGALARAREACGWRRLALCQQTRELLQPGGVALDLSAIAKGHGVDAIVELLQARGIDAALVEVGGELRGFGRKPDGTPWRVLVESGHDDDAEPCVVTLDDAAIATSGPYWQHYAAGGRIVSHTIDPRSGLPVADPPAATSVLAPSAMLADAWSTALAVMGLEGGLAFAQAQGFAVRMLPAGRGAQPRTSAAFDTRLAT